MVQKLVRPKNGVLGEGPKSIVVEIVFMVVYEIVYMVVLGVAIVVVVGGAVVVVGTGFVVVVLVVVVLLLKNDGPHFGILQYS